MAAKITTQYFPATSAYGSHMGTCYHFPAYARAVNDRGTFVEVNSEQYPNLEPQALVEKARALLVYQTKYKG